MKPGKKSKADLGFRLNRSFGTGARNSEAVTQRRKQFFRLSVSSAAIPVLEICDLPAP
jgi:hypothetical protein